MKLTGLRVINFRSIVDSGEIRIESLQAFVGENNAGKSNLLYAIQVFLTSGSGGVEEVDFNNPSEAIIIKATFSELTKSERTKLKKYLLGESLILEKHIKMEMDRRSGRLRPSSEYHGYAAEPKDWWLSISKIQERYNRPNWADIARENNILDQVTDQDGRVTKASYESGINQILIENEDIEFDEPTLGETQALGLQPVLLDALPVFRILPAITDYSNEVDRRASKTNFNLLMGDLAERILQFDPRYNRLETDFRDLLLLLNSPNDEEQRQEGQERLRILDAVEESLQSLMATLMSAVRRVRMRVELDNLSALFSRGVSILVDDGRLTDVGMKGHGLQRCIVFSLIQALIMNQRGKLIQTADNAENIDNRSIILAVEEPELYIHPQSQRLIYRVLKDFSETDQVVYTTHSPGFVDITNYHTVAVVRKDSVEKGTCVSQCELGDLEQVDERKTFQFLTSFGLEQNNMFFAKRVILVEGEEDVIAILAGARRANLIREFTEELGCSLVVTGGKQEMVKFMKLLNAFHIPYSVLHEIDGKPDADENQRIRELVGENKRVEIPHRIEELVGHDGHFHKPYVAKKFFEQNPNGITENLIEKVKELLS